MKKIHIKKINIEKLNIIKSKSNHFINGFSNNENHSRSVYSDNKYFYKIWDKNYVYRENFDIAVKKIFSKYNIACSLYSVIVDEEGFTVGYITKKGKPISKCPMTYCNFFNLLKKSLALSGYFYSDLVSSNVVLINEEPSLIDLESFYHISLYDSLNNCNHEQIKPKEWSKFIKKEYDRYKNENSNT